MAVSNTTVILYLIKIGRPDLLKNCFKQIIIPNEVYEEMIAGEEKFQREIQSLKELVKEKYILVKTVKVVKNYGLHRGEDFALSLCAELKDKTFLSDDNGARKAAITLDCKVLGTLGILLLNLRKGKISKHEFFMVLDDLVSSGFYLSTELYIEVRRRVG